MRGDTTSSRSETAVHPVVLALNDRINSNSIPGNRVDNRKIAIAIEGGGMRGCVAAGMITAIWYLGLQSAVDVVYGSSAGSLVGAYFIAGQVPYYGPEVYYDVLTSAGEEFIDTLAILRSCGLGLLDLRLDSLFRLFTDRMGKPVLNLDYLLGTIVQRIKPLNWEVFWKKQQNKEQVLKVVASGLLSRKAVVMSAETNNFKNLTELAECMKASMLLPGVTGEVMRLKGAQAESENIAKTWWREYVSWTNSDLILGSEPMSDAQMFEPVPYRSALKENCTHVIVLRTRADDLSVTAKMGLMEKMIMARFFGRKQGMPNLVTWMTKQYHKLVYAEDILILNDANRDYDVNSNKPKMLCIALPKGVPEVKRFETSRKVIFDNVREGFAAAYDSLVLDPAMRGKGLEIAKTVWPDSTMDQLPAHILEQEKKSKGVLNEELIVPKLPDEEIQQAIEKVGLPQSKRKALKDALRRLQKKFMGLFPINNNESSDVKL